MARKNKNQKTGVKMKHTEGKWIVKAQSGMLGVGVISVHTEVDGKKIFICDLPVKDVGETKSNANLIALAPEMLEMLKICVLQLPDETADEVSELIARAEEK